MLKFALIGCGRVAKRHAELLGLGQIAGARLAAVCDHVEDRARAFGEKYGVPWYVDMHAMMADETVDVVSILTPSGLHAEHLLAVAPYRKHVVLEKPMALTLDDADAMIRACAENEIRLFVVKQNRFNVPVQKLREAMEAGRFGRLVLGTVRVRWCRPQTNRRTKYSRDATSAASGNATFFSATRRHLPFDGSSEPLTA